MIKDKLKKIFRASNKNQVKELDTKVKEINALESRMEKLPDHRIKAYTLGFKERLKKGETPDDLLVEAFAVVRETAKRTLNMRHFDVQLLGGMVLYRGMIAEMKTGEGKTLAATLPAYLNALEGKGVHVVTVNDYLAGRDADWMGKIYRFLGLSVGIIREGMEAEERRRAYHCDITYTTNNELVFDYLRDNMAADLESIIQKEFNYAIIDEADFILIDEAQVPLIISGPMEEPATSYKQVNDFVEEAVKNPHHYELDEKSGTVVLTEQGVAKAEEFFNLENLFDLDHMVTLHQVYQSLKAHLLFSKDVDYLVKEDQVVIVDEFTGRMMPGRRYADGLHQALEAKENVEIKKESQIKASITLQNFFRMYKKLAGMTGTAITEAEEFRSVYNLEVAAIPTDKPVIRKEYPDVMYCTPGEKWFAVVKEIKRLNASGQPVLVGTLSIETSELLSRLLKWEKIPHQVLNAKHHEKEAEIVAQAGRWGAVTIATNMAGRGTDILLGGNPDMILKKKLKEMGYLPEEAPVELYEEFKKEIEGMVKKEHEQVINLGGLHILGTERHEARRIDNQLRGRAGRQGDPGSSQFFLSLEDNLLKTLSDGRLKGILDGFKSIRGRPIGSKLIGRLVEKAQKKIEQQNFSARKHLLEYDGVMNKQRQYIYNLRRETLKAKDIKEDISRSIETVFENLFDSYFNKETPPDEQAYPSMHKEILSQFGVNSDDVITGDYREIKVPEIKNTLLTHLKKIYREKERLVGPEKLRKEEREIKLLVIDSQWKDHLLNMTHLEKGIGLRKYAHQDPLVEYKKESYELFREMENRIEKETLRFLYFCL